MHQPRCVFVPHSGTDQCEDKPFEFFCAKRVPLQFRRDASGRMRGGKGAQVLGFDRNWLILIVELFADAAYDVWPVKPQNVDFFQAQDGIRDHCVTGVKTCALPIYLPWPEPAYLRFRLQTAYGDPSRQPE